MNGHGLAKHDDQPTDEAMALLRPHVGRLVERIDVDEFTTVEFIEAMQLDEEAKDAYRQALHLWPATRERLAKMIVHGQVIPQLLRESGRAEWSGFAHGEVDPST
jgi:hypothetical protein